MGVPRFHVERVADCEPDIGLWLAMLDSARLNTKFTLRELTSADLDAAPAVGVNTIGTVLYHIALTDLNWVYDNMLQMPYPEDVIHLFPHPLRDAQDHLSPISGWDLTAYQERLAAARKKVHEVFKPMNIASFREILQRTEDYGDYEMTPEAVLRHLTLHEMEHLGEIKLLLGALHPQN